MLNDFPVVIQRDLEWGDMDSFSHVNNIMYFRFFENARTVYFMRAKIIEEMKKTDAGPILKSTSCTFRIPLTFPDIVSMGAKVIDISTDRYKMVFAVFSHNHQKIAALGEGVVVNINYRTGEKTPLSEEVLASIEKLEGRSLRR